MEDFKVQSLKKALEKKQIKQDGCWDWTGFRDKDGYGRVSSSYAKELHAQTSHRASWIVNFGEIPKGKIVRHKCDNRICTNPEHLKLGTLKENSQDMVKAKRHAFGTKNGNSKLDEDDIKFIRKMLDRNKNQALIAELFDIHKDTVFKIKSGRSWAHIT